jgi:hypothetical protein
MNATPHRPACTPPVAETARSASHEAAFHALHAVSASGTDAG